MGYDTFTTQVSPESKAHRIENESLFDCVYDMEACGRSDEGVIKILMGFFDQFLCFPISHPSRQEKRFHGRKHYVIIHPCQLADAESNGVWNKMISSKRL